MRQHSRTSHSRQHSRSKHGGSSRRKQRMRGSRTQQRAHSRRRRRHHIRHHATITRNRRHQSRQHAGTRQASRLITTPHRRIRLIEHTVEPNRLTRISTQRGSIRVHTLTHIRISHHGHDPIIQLLTRQSPRRKLTRKPVLHDGSRTRASRITINTRLHQPDSRPVNHIATHHGRTSRNPRIHTQRLRPHSQTTRIGIHQRVNTTLQPVTRQATFSLPADKTLTHHIRRGGQHVPTSRHAQNPGGLKHVAIITLHALIHQRKRTTNTPTFNISQIRLGIQILTSPLPNLRHAQLRMLAHKPITLRIQPFIKQATRVHIQTVNTLTHPPHILIMMSPASLLTHTLIQTAHTTVNIRIQHGPELVGTLIQLRTGQLQPSNLIRAHIPTNTLKRLRHLLPRRNPRSLPIRTFDTLPTLIGQATRQASQQVPRMRSMRDPTNPIKRPVGTQRLLNSLRQPFTPQPLSLKTSPQARPLTIHSKPHILPIHAPLILFTSQNIHTLPSHVGIHILIHLTFQSLTLETGPLQLDGTLMIHATTSLTLILHTHIRIRMKPTRQLANSLQALHTTHTTVNHTVQHVTLKPGSLQLATIPVTHRTLSLQPLILGRRTIHDRRILLSLHIVQTMLLLSQRANRMPTHIGIHIRVHRLPQPTTTQPLSLQLLRMPRILLTPRILPLLTSRLRLTPTSLSLPMPAGSQQVNLMLRRIGIHILIQRGLQLVTLQPLGFQLVGTLPTNLINSARILLT